jgi:hypothetical protein
MQVFECFADERRMRRIGNAGMLCTEDQLDYADHKTIKGKNGSKQRVYRVRAGIVQTLVDLFGGFGR